MENAQQCAVLWFADIMRRHLYRELGYSSVNQYAMQELGFSKSRTRDFIRLAGQLDKLPAVKEAVISGELGYTKAREIVAVATPETQDGWLQAAKGTRQELVHEIKKVKRAARVDPGSGRAVAEGTHGGCSKGDPGTFPVGPDSGTGSTARRPGGAAAQAGGRSA